jgi:hypothetical protein
MTYRLSFQKNSQIVHPKNTAEKAGETTIKFENVDLPQIIVVLSPLSILTINYAISDGTFGIQIMILRITPN